MLRRDMDSENDAPCFSLVYLVCLSIFEILHRRASRETQIMTKSDETSVGSASDLPFKIAKIPPSPSPRSSEFSSK